MTPLSPLVAAFFGHFGEMGSRWGGNRTVGRIDALIVVSPEPLNANDIAEKLQFSRSSVSMGLKGMLELMMCWLDDAQRLDRQTLPPWMKMGSTVQRVLEFTGQLKVSHKG